jgi:hypothetical protein
VDNNPNPRFGVVLRLQDRLNYYLLSRLAGSMTILRISRVVQGKETVLATAPIGQPSRDRFFRFEGRAVGTMLTLEVDGVERLSVSDSTFSAGSVGILLGSKSAKAFRADNFGATVQ